MKVFNRGFWFGVAFAFAFFLGGCTPAGLSGIRWPTTFVAPVIPSPTVAARSPGDCVDAIALKRSEVAPCIGVLTSASDLQYLMDLEAQRAAILELVSALVAARVADRAYADAVAAKLVAQRDYARRFAVVGVVIAVVVGASLTVGVGVGAGAK